MAVIFQKMVMAGVGLICGSLALDLRRHKLVKEIVGYGRGEGNLRLAKKNGIIDSYFLDGEEFPAGVDFLMMGTPVETIVPLTKTFLPKLEPGCIISDVGSVKGEIVRGMEGLLPKDIYFVAGIRSRAVSSGARKRRAAISLLTIAVFSRRPVGPIGRRWKKSQRSGKKSAPKSRSWIHAHTIVCLA